MRIGFRIVDIHTGEFGWLALSLEKAVEFGYRSLVKRIGKYIVIEDEALRIGVNALKRFSNNKSILGIDEIGPMELSITILRLEIIKSINSTNKALLVVHKNLRDKDIIKILSEKNAQVYTITEENRDKIHEEIIKKIVQ